MKCYSMPDLDTPTISVYWDFPSFKWCCFVDTVFLDDDTIHQNFRSFWFNIDGGKSLFKHVVTYYKFVRQPSLC